VGRGRDTVSLVVVKRRAEWHARHRFTTLFYRRLLFDGGIASFLLYCLYNKDKRPAVPIDKSHLFSTVTEWRAKNDVPYDIEAFEKRLQAILLKSATGCRLPLTVQVVEKEPADRPVKVLGQIQEDDKDPALNRLLSP
jgi:hypothetical protein